MRTKFLLPLLFLFQFSAFSQPVIQWQKCYGGTNHDNTYCIEQTKDSGYIVAGATYSNNGDVTGNHDTTGTHPDYWIIKINGGGALQWQKSLGGTGDDEAYSIQQTLDGGYVVAGYSTSTDGDVSGNHGGGDYWVVKLTAGGAIHWQKCYGGSGYDEARCIRQTDDGGYIVAGYSTSNDGDVSANHGGGDYWVLKLDTGGAIQWQKCLGGTGSDAAFSIRQTSDGGYIVAGESTSTNDEVSGNRGGGDYWVAKLDTGGNIQWQKCLGGTAEDAATSILQTADGGYVVAGASASNDGDASGNHGEKDFWIVKLNSGGAIQWQKSSGGMWNDLANSIWQTTDGGYVVTGGTWSNNGDVSGNHENTGDYPDYWVLKLDSGGAIQWQKCLGGILYDQAYSIQQTTDGGYIVGGSGGSNDGDVSGNHDTTGVYNDFWVVKLSSYNGINEVNDEENVLHIYPNPLTSSSTLQLNTQLKDAEVVIYDMVGKELMRKKLIRDRMEIAKGCLERGVYFVRVVGCKMVYTQKLVVE
jgi:hypothetical protein